MRQKPSEQQKRNIFNEHLSTETYYLPDNPNTPIKSHEWLWLPLVDSDKCLLLELVVVVVVQMN